MPHHSRYDNTGMFRQLTRKEELEFRLYAHEHPNDAKYRLDNDTLCLVHPVVREEWKRMGLLSDEDLQN